MASLTDDNAADGKIGGAESVIIERMEHYLWGKKNGADIYAKQICTAPFLFYLQYTIYRLTTFLSMPCMYASRLRNTSSTIRVLASLVAHAICGVISSLLLS